MTSILPKFIKLVPQAILLQALAMQFEINRVELFLEEHCMKSEMIIRKTKFGIWIFTLFIQ